MGSVSGDVGVVVPADGVVRPLPPDGLAAVAPLVVAAGVLVDTADPVALTDVDVLVDSGDVVIEGLPDPGEDVLLLGLHLLELTDEESDVDAVCGNSNEIPVMPSTDPVWTLTIGLQAAGVVLVGPGI